MVDVQHAAFMRKWKVYVCLKFTSIKCLAVYVGICVMSNCMESIGACSCGRMLVNGI